MRKYRTAGLIAAAALVLLAAFVAIARKEPSVEANNGKGGSIWGGNYFPNIPLITHEGEKVRFFDDLIEGKVVAVNFIYTSCPDACPLETARLREAWRLLGDRVGKDVFFYSITIDPEYDTPQVLAEYRKKFRIGHGWTFLTGDKDDIIQLRKKFGIYIKDDERDNPNDHNLSLLIGNQKTGRWMKRSPFENPYIIATQLGSWLHNWKLPSKEKRDYADAPEIRNISPAEDLFRTRCASCHTIGQGDVTDTARQLVGPDLLNVTATRERQWLLRWLMEPDKMLEEKDPLAMALFLQYDQVSMPNMRIGFDDAQRLLEFIEEESQRIEQERRHRQMSTGSE